MDDACNGYMAGTKINSDDCVCNNDNATITIGGSSGSVRCNVIKMNKPTEVFNPYLVGLWLGTSRKYLIRDHYSYKRYMDLDIQTYCDELLFDTELDEAIDKYKIGERNHIPQEYIENETNNRLSLLAGIIDAVGILEDNITFKIINYEYDKLTDDIISLSRSLEFPTTIAKKYNSLKYLCFEIEIKGNIVAIPVKCRRNIVAMMI